MITVKRFPAAIMPDDQDFWDPAKAYAKNTWVYHDNANWTARRNTVAGEEPGQAAGPNSPWLPGPSGPCQVPQSWLLAGDVESFDDGFFNWTNHGDSTGHLVAHKNCLVRVWCQGGGAGGGGGYAGQGLTAGGGGASGVTVVKPITLVAGDTIPVSLGAAGAGGKGHAAEVASDGTGEAGGRTTFGDRLFAPGGGAGKGWNWTTTSPHRVVNIGGTCPIPAGQGPGFGQNGGDASPEGLMAYEPNSVYSLVSGRGGHSPFGQGGARAGSGSQATSQATDGYNASGYGAGGGGGAGSKARHDGGDGSPGCIYLERMA